MAGRVKRCSELSVIVPQEAHGHDPGLRHGSPLSPDVIGRSFGYRGILE
jgi:hypothetical protein